MLLLLPLFFCGVSQLLAELSWPGCPRGSCVYAVAPDSAVDPGKLALNGTQRDDCFVALDKVVSASPFRTTATSIVQTLTVSVELRAAGSADAPFLELDATKLSKQFAKQFNGQVRWIGCMRVHA